MDSEERAITTSPERQELIERLRALRESIGFIGDSTELIRESREERDAQVDEIMGWNKK